MDGAERAGEVRPRRGMKRKQKTDRYLRCGSSRRSVSESSLHSSPVDSSYRSTFDPWTDSATTVSTRRERLSVCGLAEREHRFGGTEMRIATGPRGRWIDMYRRLG